jgi:Domain of unknown function (DUF1877)
VGIIGEYVRVAQRDLERLHRDPWAFYWASTVSMQTPGWENRPSTEPWLSLDKAWDALGYLLEEATDGTIDVVRGGAPIGKDEEFGFGPPRYLTPEEVRQAADMLRRTPFDRLAAHYDAGQLRAAEIYPRGWDWDAGQLRALQRYFEELMEFFAVAAAHGDGMLLLLV